MVPAETTVPSILDESETTTKMVPEMVSEMVPTTDSRDKMPRLDDETTVPTPQDMSEVPEMVPAETEMVPTESEMVPTESTLATSSSPFVPLPLARDPENEILIKETTTRSSTITTIKLTTIDTKIALPDEETTMDSKTFEDEITTIYPTVPEVPDLVPEMVPSEPTSSTAVPEIKETEQETTTDISEMEGKTMVPELVPDIMVPTDSEMVPTETTQKPIFDKVVDFITTTLKSVISEQESTQAPPASGEDMITQIPELSDETDDMKTMAPELEKEITTMQMIIDSVSEITTMVPESVPEMVPTDTRDKMPRLDDEDTLEVITTIAPEIDTIVDDTTMMVPEMVDTKETTEKEEIVPPTTVQPSVKETTSEPSMVSDGSDTITTIQPLVEDKPIDTTIATIELEDKLFGETDLETNLFETSTLSSTSTTSSSTISSTTSTIIDGEENLLDDDEEEVFDVEDPESTENESVHTLQCLPNGQTQSGEMIMSCKEQPDRQPITVIISSEGLDLTTLARKNVKIVVKDYMLMEMQQRPVAVKPRRR